MKKFCYILLVLASFMPVRANTPDETIAPAGTMRLGYRIGQNSPDMTQLANRKAYNDIVREVAKRRAAGEDVAVEVTYFSAPGAGNYINKGIGQNRSELLKADLLSHVSLSDSAFIVTDGGDGWAELYRIVNSMPDMKHRDEVLRIIKGDPYARVVRLKKIDKGRTYAYMHDNIFPLLRNNILVRVGQPAVLADARRADRNLGLDIAWSYKVDGCVDCGCSETPQAEPQTKIVYVAADTEPVDYGKWAFKTNLVYDFILTPSIEIEYHFSPQWSFNIEYEMGWWKNKGKNKTFEVAEVSPEVRWWFKSPTPASGYYIGAFPGFAWYDFENGGTGHRGHGVFGGVSFGFVRPLTDKLSFEAGLGVGYLNLRYKDYEPVDGHHVYHRTKDTGYFGPLKVKLALVWHPWARKSGKKQTAAK